MNGRNLDRADNEREGKQIFAFRVDNGAEFFRFRPRSDVTDFFVFEGEVLTQERVQAVLEALVPAYGGDLAGGVVVREAGVLGLEQSGEGKQTVTSGTRESMMQEWAMLRRGTLLAKTRIIGPGRPNMVYFLFIRVVRAAEIDVILDTV